MKNPKRYFWSGLISLILGLGFLAVGIFKIESTLGSLLCGLGGGSMGSGLAQLWRYAKWSRNMGGYREKLEQEQIDLRDERKEMLRCKAGRYAYQLGLVVCLLGAFVTALLGALGLVEHYLPVLYLLTGYVVFQYVAGVVIYRRLSRRY